MDGTGCRICRPYSHNNNLLQEVCYDGMNREHCLAILVGVLPNGMIPFLVGPCEGRHHDSWLQNNSDVEKSIVWSSSPASAINRNAPPTYHVHVFDSSFELSETAADYIKDPFLSIKDVVIYSDQGFRSTVRLHTPYSKNIIRRYPSLLWFNQRMSSAREEMEHGIHLLKGDFPILKKTNSFIIRNMKNIIEACAILVNVRNSYRPNSTANS